MNLLPAIDIRGGRCVRLLKGDFGQETRYPVDPVELAQRYADLGAAWLHVVDLDGAAQGAPANLEIVQENGELAAKLKIQLGGGIRSRDDLNRALEVVDRAVIGSLAVEAREQVTGWLAELGADRLTLALDVRVDEDDIPGIATHGWTRDSAETLWKARWRPTRLQVCVMCCAPTSSGTAPCRAPISGCTRPAGIVFPVSASRPPAACATAAT